MTSTTDALWKRGLQRAAWDALDVRDRISGRSSELMPPRRLANLAGGVRDFDVVGKNWLERFRVHAGLEPQHDVLDVGCGVGRVAVALTRFTTGRYEGFDILEPAVTWCRDTITPRFPHFQFSHADVWNPMYNPRGAVRAEEFTFPFGDDSFDFVFATSVFTHMLPAEVDQYCSETARVLRPGGTCLLTFYLLDEVAKAAVAQGRARQPFTHALDGCFVTHPDVPTAAVAYEPADALAFLEKHGLAVEEVSMGTWSGHQSTHGQDFVVARRAA